MNVKDHGKWVKYKPERLPESAPAGAMFARRESDGQDWYLYVHAPLVAVTPVTMKAVDPFNFGSFEETSVKFTALWQEAHGAYIVGAAVYDPTMLFPAGCLLGEILDYAGADPQADFGNKIYDPVAATFSDIPPPAEGEIVDVRAIVKLLGDIVARLDKLEGSK